MTSAGTATARVLVVAGSDSGGGAGVQADIKTVMALGGYATTAITALTAQDTQGVHGVLDVPVDFIKLQIERVMADIGADAFKTGMLGDAARIEAVATLFADYAGMPFVLDPVMVAKGGYALLKPDAVASLKRVLMPLASVVTPNVPEAEALSGTVIETVAEMERAADMLLTLGAPAVLLKGGHLVGETVTDVLATEAGTELFTAARVNTQHTHGTGCTLASAIATGLAQGSTLREAVLRARAYVQSALATAPGLGHGHGPLGHSAAWKQGGY